MPVAAGLALSPFAGGYYDSSIWAPAGIGLLVVLTAVLVARVPRPSAAAIAAVLGLLGLAAWSLLSATWTDSIQQAVVEGNRVLVYAAGLGLLVVLVRDDRAAAWLLAAIGAGAAVVAAVVVARALGADEEMLLDGRVNEPLGYVNGQASLFVLALWPFLALALQRRSAPLAGVGLGGATLFGALIVLSQSRGAVLAVAVSTLVVLTVLPHRLRRVSALLVLGAGLGPAVPTLLDVYSTAKASGAVGDSLRDAGTIALIAAAAVGVVWAAAVRWETSLAASRPAAVTRIRRALVAGLAVVSVVAGSVALASAGHIADYVDRQYDAFVHLQEPSHEPTSSRLVAGAGHRYDYWRIAIDAWESDVLRGVGAGGYDKPYFAARSTMEDIRQPHSLPLQVLVELGLVGLALLAVFLVAIAAGARRQVQRARAGEASGPVIVAALGIVTAWLVHTSVDWIHLLPGLTGIALCGAAILLRYSTGPDAANAGRPIARTALAVAMGLALAAATFSLSRQALAEHYGSEAKDALAAQPRRALHQANRSLRLDPENVASYYTKAAALARFGEADAARAVLLDAARREPRDFVTWTLLGDLAVRRGKLSEARLHYGRAARLNPRDEALAGLARDPRRAY